MKHRFNTEHLMPMSRYQKQIAKAIDEAEWLGNFKQADLLKDEYDRAIEQSNAGAIYHPLH